MKTGDKIVCVDDQFSELKEHPYVIMPDGCPVKDQVYCADQMFPERSLFWRGNTNETIRLVVCGMRVLLEGEEIGWPAECFRLVSEIGHPPIQVEQPEFVEL